jgi:hypothetical protein
MNEMDELSRFRAEIPDRGTARAEEIFRAGLTEELSSERRSASPPRNRLRQRRLKWRLAIAAPLALGLAAGVTVAVLPSGPPVLTVQLLADRAAAAALTDPDVPAGQWIYVVTEHTFAGGRAELRPDLPAVPAPDQGRDQAVPAGAEGSRQGDQPVQAGQPASGAARISPPAAGHAQHLPHRLRRRRR